MFVPTTRAEVSGSLFTWGFRRATWLRDRLERVAVRKAQDRAYERFAEQHPRWAASLFDQHFLTLYVTPLLMRGLQSGDRPAPIELALAWFEQCNARASREPELSSVIRVAADYLRTFEDELRQYQGRG